MRFARRKKQRRNLNGREPADETASEDFQLSVSEFMTMNGNNVFNSAHSQQPIAAAVLKYFDTYTALQ